MIECEKLIKRMLVIEPSKRVTISQIMSDKWYTEGYSLEASSAPPPITPEEHELVLDELEELGLEKDAVRKSIQDGTYDSLTATYYLVADRRASGKPGTSEPKTPLGKLSPALKTSRATELDVLNEDEDAPQTSSAATQPSSVQATTKALTATTAQPPKVVAGRRRAATTMNADVVVATPQPGLPANTQLPLLDLPQVPSHVQPESERTRATTQVPVQEVHSRHRAHTTIQIPKDLKDDDDITTPIDQFRKTLQEQEPRTAKFTFSVSTTSTKDAQEVFGIVLNVLKLNKVGCEAQGLVASCKVDDLIFEIEVCRLKGLDVVGLRCKRLSGDMWSYKELLGTLIGEMKLE